MPRLKHRQQTQPTNIIKKLGGFDKIHNIIKNSASKKKSGGFFSELWSGVKDFVGGIVDTGKELVGTVTGSVKSVFTTVKDVSGNLSSGISNSAQNLTKGIGEGVGGLGKGVGGLAEGIGKNLPILAIGGAILGFAFLRNK